MDRHTEDNVIHPARAASSTIVALVLFTFSATTHLSAFELDRAHCSMEILVDGVPVSEYSVGGSAYVEARPGREYAIRLTNRTASRIAVALSVDGLNTITAKTTSARDASKWILGPFESITIEGWQTSSATARRFFFTTEARSYGAWLGRTKNLGLIAAAVFRERVPAAIHGRRQDPAPYPSGPYGAERTPGATQGDRPSGPGEPRGSGAREPKSEEGRSLNEGQEGLSPSAGMRKESAALGLSDDLAATGIGTEMDHRVVDVRFDQEDTPVTVMEVRYEYRPALVKLGVLPRCADPCDERLARRERARGFEEYAPDPYRRQR